MIRSLLVLVAALLLAACASTSNYHRGYGGGDYYYGAASDSYYAQTPDRVCTRSVQYGYYGDYRCQSLGWGTAVGAWPYAGWDGWGDPYAYYGAYAPWYGWNGGWSGSLWFGLGSGAWAYPGYYNPWFGPWWPYSVVYPVQRHSFRDRQRLHREQALQAAWRRHASMRSAASMRPSAHGSPATASVVQRQNADARRRNSVIRGRAATGFPAGSRRRAADNNVSGTATMPRGRPSERGIPVNWPVGHREPRRHDAFRPQPRNRPQTPAAQPRPERRGQEDAATIYTQSARSAPLPGPRSPDAFRKPVTAPQPRRATRPLHRTFPTTVTPSHRSPTSTSRPSRPSAPSRPRTHSASSPAAPVTRMPRGQPDKHRLRD